MNIQLLNAQLYTSVSLGDVEEIEILIKQLNKYVDMGPLYQDFLRIAVKNDHFHLVNCFLKKGANLGTLIYSAIPSVTIPQGEDQSKIKERIQKWVKTIEESEEYQKSLKLVVDFITVLKSNPPGKALEEIKKFIENGGNIHYNNDQLFVYVAITGNLEALKYLINKNVNILANKNIVYKVLAEHGNVEILKFVLEQTPNKQKPMEDAFITATESNQVEIMKYLISQNLNIENIIPQALNNVFGYNSMDALLYLVELGVKLEGFYKQGLKTTSFSGFCEMIEYLVEDGGDINIVKENGNAQALKWVSAYELKNKLNENLDVKDKPINKIKI